MHGSGKPGNIREFQTCDLDAWKSMVMNEVLKVMENHKGNLNFVVMLRSYHSL